MAQSKFADTKVHSIFDFLVERTGPHIEMDWEAFSRSKNIRLDPNIKYCKDPNFRKENGIKYFLMDDEDRKLLQEAVQERKSPAEEVRGMVKSLADCSKHHKKNIHLRVVGTDLDNSPRFFCDDVLEVIPILLEYQGTGIGFSEKQKLEKYQKKWKASQDYICKTIEIATFSSILEEFDCNKSLITIHPDCVLRNILAVEAVRKGPLISTWSNDGCSVVDIPNALRFICSGVVEGVNWKVEKCRMHDYCLNNLKTEILKAMRVIVNFGEGVYIKMSYIVKVIEELKNNCYQIYHTPELCPDYFFRHVDHTDFLEPGAYTRVVSHYKLPEYNNFLGKNLRKPVWMMRFYVQLGWLQNFFTPGKSDGIRDLCLSALLHLVPIDERDKAKTFMTAVFESALEKSRSTQGKQDGKKSNNYSKTHQK
ncbi:hypothetical protein CAEBREN_02436 [Caenorhabditis brenneri]|uniref:Uncharacterized protein n=1 Tax=Caenorhabditis brenneri TaxID=135651 RepID=G0N9A2_CAEBE|nr:hypothetical protein CAEBREN_02436 [Caenorhabditis brenneri]